MFHKRDLPEGLEVQYRVHIQNEGWQEWKRSGEVAGTEAKSLRLEAIEIRIAEKLPKISYKSHIQNEGWQLLHYFSILAILHFVYEYYI